jgi:hypothetical protein
VPSSLQSSQVPLPPNPRLSRTSLERRNARALSAPSRRSGGDAGTSGTCARASATGVLHGPKPRGHGTGRGRRCADRARRCDVKKKYNWGDLHSGMQQGACARASPRCTRSLHALRSVAEMARARLPWRLLQKRSVGGEEWSLTVEAARKVRKGPGNWPARRFHAACCHEIRKI